MSEEPETELGNGSADDIYEWFTSIPDELCPVKKGIVRADSILGINRIGRMTNRPIRTSDNMPENKGTCISCVMQQDVKAGSWSVKLLLPVIHHNLEAWGTNFRNYLHNNLDKLKEHAERIN